jgi:hypothetical protein
MLWKGATLGAGFSERVVTLMRMVVNDEERVRADLRGAPIYLIGAMDGDNIWRLKPQNLLASLPLVESKVS